MPATPGGDLHSREAGGHEGACAESGQEALRRLREHSGLLNRLKKWKVEPASKE